MKQFLLSVHSVEGEPAPDPDVVEKMYRDVDALNQEIRAAGAWVFAGGLHPSSTATTLRVRGGEVITTDGPYAETKEQLGGFWIIAVKDLDEALSWGAKATVPCAGPVEVRPFQEEPEG